MIRACSALCTAQVVHFVRHGEGFHNVGFDELEDSPLTHKGWADAEALRAHLDTLEATGNPLQCEVRT
jgi:broad specificity phosphatase PhoE